MANFERLYKDYSTQYKKAIEKAANKGEPFFDTVGIYSKIEFKTMYEGMQNDMREKGRTVTPDKTIKALVEKQTYSRSLEQAQILKKAMSERGFNVTIHEARVWGGLEGDPNAPQGFQVFWNEIKAKRKELKASGRSNEDIAKLIAIKFFGS